ncbi:MULTISPECIES: hypothetical protein [Streptomyces]|uniref:Antibiotic biosynthesis monooxygenase n=1 Tax=Streptomyces griseocarneus TaxID=51201 RepID=A0ABX7RN57_9ACTN|nr:MULTISPECIES: hypothetical protein [Streptomyces]QSY49701.1 antibiotic biosynthesis monooxygenase [Streptomyces griseocarneus]
MTRLTGLRRPDAGITLISRWGTGTPERTRAAADALLEQWSAADAPAILLATHVFTDVDGSGLLIHGQWTSAEEHQAFVRDGRAARVGRIDARVPGIERSGLSRTHPYRGVVLDADGEAGVFAVACHETDGAPGGARAWADARVDALREGPPPGLLAAHLHLDADGRRVVEISEWADGAEGEAPARLAGLPLTRYRFYGSADR